jgi:Xaa-Pro dipeptidase
LFRIGFMTAATPPPHSDAQRLLAGLRPWRERADRIGPGEREHRIARVQASMATAGVDALLVHAGASLRYFTGIPWGATERLVALLVPQSGEPFLIGPEFERGSLRAASQVSLFQVGWEEHEDPCAVLAEALRAVGVETLALDPELPWRLVQGLQRNAAAARLVDGAPLIDADRMHKSEAELALIRQAMAMTLEVHRQAAMLLRPGITTGEVRRFIDEAHRALGADGGSTFCAVQFGVATAYPHGLPGEQALQADDLVLIDTGCQVDGYHSDITRTYAFGRPHAEHADAWSHERDAQQAAFDAVRPGVACEEIDAVARRSLARNGYGPAYRLPGLPHRTGHGLGLSIHEPAYLVQGDTRPLARGMCFSNEPMIVVPERFGIRLEDHFHVTDDGARWFTPPATSFVDPFGLRG